MLKKGWVLALAGFFFAFSFFFIGAILTTSFFRMIFII